MFILKEQENQEEEELKDTLLIGYYMGIVFLKYFSLVMTAVCMILIIIMLSLKKFDSFGLIMLFIIILTCIISFIISSRIIKKRKNDSK